MRASSESFAAATLPRQENSPRAKERAQGWWDRCLGMCRWMRGWVGIWVDRYLCVVGGWVDGSVFGRIDEGGNAVT